MHKRSSLKRFLSALELTADRLYPVAMEVFKDGVEEHSCMEV